MSGRCRGRSIWRSDPPLSAAPSSSGKSRLSATAKLCRMRSPPATGSTPEGDRMFVEQLRQAISAAPRRELPKISALLWRAFAAGSVTEAQASELSDLIETRKALPAAEKPVQRRVGSRPHTPASMARRRSWAAAGRLPPQIASRFTLAEQAVLAVVALEVVKRGSCRLAIDHIAALAGVGRSSVKNALREAHGLGLVRIEERRLTGFRNDTNVVTILSAEWTSWLRLRRGGGGGGGVKTVTGTTTSPDRSARLRLADPVKEAAGRQRAEPTARDEIRTRDGQGRGGAMR